jgi:rRNA-processing protein FCF1
MAEAGVLIDKNHLLFALHAPDVNFKPEVSKEYLDKLDKAIASTTVFIEQIKANPTLVKAGACGVYLYAAQQEIAKTIQAIEQYKTKNSTQDLSKLTIAIDKLSAYKATIDNALYSQKMSYTNSQYYSLIKELITQVEAYEKSQYGMTRLTNDNNKIKIAQAVLTELKSLKNQKIDQINLDGIFELSNPGAQDKKDIADLKAKLGATLIDNIKKLVEHCKAYMKPQAVSKDVSTKGTKKIKVNNEGFYAVKEDDESESEYEDCISEIAEDWDRLSSIFDPGLNGSDSSNELHK